jgi:hypothetical protein
MDRRQKICGTDHFHWPIEEVRILRNRFVIAVASVLLDDIQMISLL